MLLGECWVDRRCYWVDVGWLLEATKWMLGRLWVSPDWHRVGLGCCLMDVGVGCGCCQVGVGLGIGGSHGVGCCWVTGWLI